MKVLFINTYDFRGGAAIIAYRLMKNLEKNYKAECFYIVAFKTLDDQNIFRSRPNRIAAFIEKAINKCLNVIGLQYFFLPVSSSTILKIAKHIKPDIISLHNTHGGYFQTSLIKKISNIAPVVWTLHDMWSFTGNAAHTFGDESWKEMKNSKHLAKISPAIGINTGAFLLQQKAKIYKQSKLIMVTPSKWLADLAHKSPAFKGKRIIHIFNGLDLDVFKPSQNNEIRAKLNINSQDRVLMFSAEVLTDNIWKGGDALLHVIKLISEKIDLNLHLLIIGKGEIKEMNEIPNVVIHQIGYLQDENEMSKYLSASDLFIYPTKADNLPNVLIEAIACGTPCVTFNIGGCSEIIINDYNGIIIEPFDFVKMAHAITQLLENGEQLKEMSTNARAYAEAKFSIQDMSKKYIDLFHSLNNPNL
jgi:glycosyltransferase involved in cell wall biosynthesis